MKNYNHTIHCNYADWQWQPAIKAKDIYSSLNCLGVKYGPLILHIVLASVHYRPWMHLTVLQIKDPSILGSGWDLNLNFTDRFIKQQNNIVKPKVRNR